ncbi:MAG TPA: flavin reductase family protein [Stellaceae bacterium]|nr:flavin reductase family protein [Stellaceae bacterium]
MDDLRGRFLGAMSCTASTVNVVTTDGAGGRAGVTVSAMSSVSADGERPILLVCVHHLSPAASAIARNRVFCVNVLRDDQWAISDSFAGRGLPPGADKFACTEWETAPTGSPRVADPLVAFDCRILSHQRIGTHVVFYGEVEEIFQAEAGTPLIYTQRAYGTPRRLEAA